MVRLNRAVVIQGISKVSFDKRDEIEIDKEFGRITHLHLQRKNITMLDSLHLFSSLTVLYLYENEISKIEGLEQAFNLEILHLQRNRLQRIENLLNCKRLRKLYLGYNEIETVEGLHTLELLEELHIENQRLENGMSVSFDPKSLNTLCNCLMVLNISGNNITHIEDLAGMEELHTLLVSQNSIQNLDSTSLVVRTLSNLRVLDLQDNAIARKPQFKERLIGFGKNIEILNGKTISDSTRDFIQRFVSVKASRLENAIRRSNVAVAPDPPVTPEGQRPSFYDYEYIPSNSPYASSASLGDSKFEITTPCRMSPTKSNLILNLPGQVYPFQFPRTTPQPSRRSLSQMQSYLSQVPQKKQPQFILAPPSFHQDNISLGGDSGDLRPSLRRRHVSVPSFKRSPSVDTKDDDLFKTPKVSAEEMWASHQRTALKHIKTPTPMQRCSRQAFPEGMPMPSTSMLRMAPSSPSHDLSVIYNNRGSGRGSAYDVNNVVTRGGDGPSNKSLSDPETGRDKPQFTTSVVEFPPWPHIFSKNFENTKIFL